MQQLSRLGPEPLASEADQIVNRAAGAFDPRKSVVARPRRARLADHQERHRALVGQPRQRPHAVGAGAQDGLDLGEIGRWRVAVINLEQRLDERRDASRGKRRGQALGLGARPGHQGAHSMARWNDR